jgi:hypothetical protein
MAGGPPRPPARARQTARGPAADTAPCPRPPPQGPSLRTEYIRRRAAAPPALPASTRRPAACHASSCRGPANPPPPVRARGPLCFPRILPIQPDAPLPPLPTPSPLPPPPQSAWQSYDSAAVRVSLDDHMLLVRERGRHAAPGACWGYRAAWGRGLAPGGRASLRDRADCMHQRPGSELDRGLLCSRKPYERSGVCSPHARPRPHDPAMGTAARPPAPAPPSSSSRRLVRVAGGRGPAAGRRRGAVPLLRAGGQAGRRGEPALRQGGGGRGLRMGGLTTALEGCGRGCVCLVQGAGLPLQGLPFPLGRPPKPRCALGEQRCASHPCFPLGNPLAPPLSRRQELLASGLLVEVPTFSKFLHGGGGAGDETGY